ncbi:MAG: dihydropteroate synthase [Nitrospirota bacterium]
MRESTIHPTPTGSPACPRPCSAKGDRQGGEERGCSPEWSDPEATGAKPWCGVHTILKGKNTEVVIGRDQPTVIIGERINPTGKKRLARDLKSGDMSYIKEEALRQVAAGAVVIDINVGSPEIDEPKALVSSIKAVIGVVDVPISIDSSNVSVIKSALKVCPGKPLINSTTGEEKTLKEILPLVKEYGSSVVALTMDENGIPQDCDGRFEIAKKIIQWAEDMGITHEDVIIDPMVMTVAADYRSALSVLDAIERIATELKVNLVIGGSNISHGLPERSVINAAFLSMAIQRGLTMVIADPTVTTVRQAILASDLLMGKDEFAIRYISHYRKMKDST